MINLIQFEKQINKIAKLDYYKIYIIEIILLAYDEAINIFNNDNIYLLELNKIISKTNNILININKYLKYKNTIKLHHWFNIEGINILL